MKEDKIHKSREPKHQKSWQFWEEQLISKAAGSFTSEQIANMLVFLGSDRNKGSVIHKAGKLGWSLRLANKAT